MSRELPLGEPVHGETGGFLLAELHCRQHERPSAPLGERPPDALSPLPDPRGQVVKIQMDGGLSRADLHPDLVQRLERNIRPGHHVDEYTVGREVSPYLLKRDRRGDVLRAGHVQSSSLLVDVDPVGRAVECEHAGGVDRREPFEPGNELLPVACPDPADGKHGVFLSGQSPDGGNRVGYPPPPFPGGLPVGVRAIDAEMTQDKQFH